MSDPGDDRGFDPAWAALGRPYRTAIDLAWRSCAAGTIGVGSVITDLTGGIIAEGRNRVYDAPGGDGVLQGNRLAHAEMNALAVISTQRDLKDCTLWSTQQPCILCASAAVMAGVGTVRYLAADPFFAGVERLPELNVWIAQRWPRQEGPSPDNRWIVCAAIIQLYAAATKNPTGEVMQTSHREEPESAALIEHLVRERTFGAAIESGSSAAALITRIWPQILLAAAQRDHRVATDIAR